MIYMTFDSREKAALKRVGGSSEGEIILEMLNRYRDDIRDALEIESIEGNLRKLQGAAKVLNAIIDGLDK